MICTSKVDRYKISNKSKTEKELIQHIKIIKIFQHNSQMNSEIYPANCVTVTQITGAFQLNKIAQRDAKISNGLQFDNKLLTKTSEIKLTTSQVPWVSPHHQLLPSDHWLTEFTQTQKYLTRYKNQLKFTLSLLLSLHKLCT